MTRFVRIICYAVTQVVIPLAVLAMILMALGGCAEQRIIMKNPRTGQVIQCVREGPLFTIKSEAKDCADALQRDGWIRLDK